MVDVKYLAVLEEHPELSSFLIEKLNLTEGMIKGFLKMKKDQRDKFLKALGINDKNRVFEEVLKKYYSDIVKYIPWLIPL